MRRPASSRLRRVSSLLARLLIAALAVGCSGNNDAAPAREDAAFEPTARLDTGGGTTPIDGAAHALDTGTTAAPDATNEPVDAHIADAAADPLDAGPADARRTDAGVDAAIADSGGDTGVRDTGARDSGRRPDAAGSDPDSGPSSDSGTTADSGSTEDGMPVRMQCSTTFGNGLSTDFGRMDGILVSIVPIGGPRSCHGDSTHLHLQVAIQRSVYDVAVNTTGQVFESEVALSSAWSEGWHPGVTFDYPQVGIHSTSFVNPVPSAQAVINAFLQTANHVSIYATGYSASGAHNVHRHLNGTDGAIIINPLSAHPRGLFFRFTQQTF